MIRTLRTLLIFSSLFFSAGAAAGGFQLNTQGQRQFGMGHTGTGLFTDAATIFFNPGGLCMLDTGWQAGAGLSLLFPRTLYQEPQPGVYNVYMEPNTGTPLHAYVSFRPQKMERLAFGLGLYTPYGSRAEWPSDWKGQFIIRSISLKTFYIQPTVACKITDWLSAGAGFVYATGNFSLEKGVPVQDSLGRYGSAALEGDASGFGWNAGLAARFGEHWTFGVSMRSGVNVEVASGSADFTVPPALAEYFPDGTFSTRLGLPSTISAGAGYSMGPWKFALDVNRTGWSSYDSLRIDFAENTDKLEDVHSARLYKDVYTIRGGAEYTCKENWQFRGGVYYDQTPVQDGYLTPETPDMNRIGLTAGISYAPLPLLTIHATGLYSQGRPRTDTNIETGFSGKFSTKAVAAGIGLGVKF